MSSTCLPPLTLTVTITRTLNQTLTPPATCFARYEQHLRAVLGWPLGDSSLTVGAAIMLNVLGEADGADGMRRAHRLMGRAYEVRSVAL